MSTSLLDRLASRFGIALADMTYIAALAFGIKPCKSCSSRNLVLRRIEQIGTVQAIRLICKTLAGVELTDDEITRLEQGYGLDP